MLRGCSVSRRRSARALALICPLILAAQEQTFEASFQHGTEAMRGGQLDDAAANFAKCIASQPKFAESYLNLGLIRLQQGQTEESAGLLRQALKLKPNLRGAELFEGIAEYRLDQYKDAQISLKRAAVLEPSNPEALMWLGISELAIGDAASAVGNLEKASKLKPNNVDILYHLGRAYMQMSKETYEVMYQADPSSWRVHQVLAQSFKDADRLDDAIKECLEAIKVRPAEPGLHQMLGDIYWKQNNLERAEVEFQAELKIDPQDFTAMSKLGTLSVERSKPEIALQLLIAVVQKHPESREAHYQLGRAEAQTGNTDDAIRDFSTAASAKGPIDPEILRNSYYQLAQSYRRAKRLDESRIALNTFARLKQEADAQQDEKLQDKLKRSTESQQ